MIKPSLFDVIELLQPLAKEGLPAGSQGTIVDQYNDQTFEVEFSDDLGRTIALAALSREQFIVVWKAETEQALPPAEQIAQLVEILPPQAGQEVLNFARFLTTRRDRQLASPLAT
jgi:hypothetical protein